MMRSLAALASCLAACSGGGGGDEPVRQVSIKSVRFDARGVSRPIRVLVPERSRSLAVVARGDQGTLYALAWLETADGVEHVRLPQLADLGAAMRERYFTERIGLMPGALRQSIRLGTFSHVHPNRPGLIVPAGEAVLRIATSDPAAGPVDVEILMPADDGGRTLPVNVFTVSDTRSHDSPDELTFLPPLQAILGPAGVQLVVERVIDLPGSGLSRMSELSAPQEPPTSASAQLALLGGAMVGGDALNLFIIDSLPDGIFGWSLGTPGPPIPDTCYSGVVAREAPGPDLALVLAHEIGHYLGLPHPVDLGTSGALYRDQLHDAVPAKNLMSGEGMAVTQDQAHVLSRSPLLH